MDSPLVTTTVSINLEPQPEGVYTVTCNELPELITEGSTLEEILKNVEEAFNVVVGLYKSTGRELPLTLNSSQNKEHNHITLTAPLPVHAIHVQASHPKTQETRL